MREITRLTTCFLYLISLLSVVGCVQELNVTGTLIQLTPEVTTCADIYARLLTKPLSNPLLGSLSYSDTQETIPHEFITLKQEIWKKKFILDKGKLFLLREVRFSSCLLKIQIRRYMKSIISALRAKWMKVLKIGSVCILP